MVKIIWPVLVLAGAALLITAQQTVSGTIDIFPLLNTTINATTTNSTGSTAFNASLQTLVGIMNNFKPVFLNLYNLTLTNNPKQPNTTNIPAAQLPSVLSVLSFAQVLPTFNQLATSVVTILNNNMRNRTTQAPRFSVYDFLNSTAKMFNINLDSTIMQLSFNSTPNATVPAVFVTNLNKTATLLLQLLPITNATLSITNSSSVVKSVFASIGIPLPLLNSLLTQIQPLLFKPTVPTNLTEALAGLVDQIGSITRLVTQYLPANLTLVTPDPDWDHTCGTFFTDNLNKMNDLWNQTSTALIGALNSTTDPKLTAVSVAIRGVGIVLPILTNLTGQIGVLVDGMTPKYNRRLYPKEVRINRYKSDCHLRHLQRLNARRLG